MNQYTSAIMAAVLLVAALHAVVAAIRTDLPWRRWRVAAMLVCRLALLGGRGGVVVRRAASPAAGRRPCRVARAGRPVGLDRPRRAGDRPPLDRAGPGGCRRSGRLDRRADAGGRGRPGQPLGRIAAGRPAGLSRPGRQAVPAAFRRRRHHRRSAGRSPAACSRTACRLYAVAGGRGWPANRWSPISRARRPHGTPCPRRSRRCSNPTPRPLPACVAGIDGKQQAQQQLKLRRRADAPSSMPVVFDRDGLHQVEVRAEFAQDRLGLEQPCGGRWSTCRWRRGCDGLRGAGRRRIRLRAVLEAAGLHGAASSRPRTCPPEFVRRLHRAGQRGAPSAGRRAAAGAGASTSARAGRWSSPAGGGPTAPAATAARRWSRSSPCISIPRRNIRPSPWSWCWTTPGR